MPDERMWYYFIYASLGTYFSALLLAGLNYTVKGMRPNNFNEQHHHYLTSQHSGRNTTSRNVHSRQRLNFSEVSSDIGKVYVGKMFNLLQSASFACEIQEWADSVNSGQSLPGRILVVFVWLCNLMSMVSCN